MNWYWKQKTTWSKDLIIYISHPWIMFSFKGLIIIWREDGGFVWNWTSNVKGVEEIWTYMDKGVLKGSWKLDNFHGHRMCIILYKIILVNLRRVSLLRKSFSKVIFLWSLWNVSRHLSQRTPLMSWFCIPNMNLQTNEAIFQISLFAPRRSCISEIFPWYPRGRYNQKRIQNRQTFEMEHFRKNS